MTCVCGHSEESHREFAMSVPLKPGSPPARMIGMPGIFLGHPNAKYVGVLCSCGCSIYEPDK